MAIIAKDNGGEGFEPMPSGTYLAVCNMVVDLGLQQTEYQGEKKVKHQIYLRWETPSERIAWKDRDTGEEKEGARVIGKKYTLSLHENANLRADLKNWRGRDFTDEEREGFDVSKLLGVPCMISVTHDTGNNGKTYANVSGVAKLPKEMDAPQSEIGLLLYDNDNQEGYGNLNKYLQETINKQVTADDADKTNDPDAWREDANAELDDDVPF